MKTNILNNQKILNIEKSDSIKRYNVKLKTSYIHKFFIFILFFIYIYPIHLKGLPFNFNILIGTFSMGYLIIYSLLNKKTSIIIEKKYFVVITFLLIVSFVSIFTIAINGTFDIYFIKQSLIDFITLFTIYIIIRYIFTIYREIDFLIIGKYLTGVVLVQMLISLILSMEPGLRDISFSILATSEDVAATIERVDGTRLVGFGTAFFTSGIINSFTLLVICVIIKKCHLEFHFFFFFIFSFIVIFLIGMMMARTTLVGFGLGIIYIIFAKSNYSDYPIRKYIKKTIVILLGIILFFFLLIPDDVLFDFDVFFNFGYELIINYIDSGEVRSGSLDSMTSMFKFPEEMKTWIIGDGYFSDPNNSSLYYKNTDIGFLRIIYYFGIAGFISLSLLHIVVLYYCWKANDKKYGLFYFFCFVMYLILNIKGVVNLFMYIIPFLFIHKKFSTKLRSN